ncbi:hypothetical protein AB0B04_33020 [Streptomyces xinghaiensis]|uniref:hypothetical protein n=1 Tax=Kocuria rhizophila TaxID=72000 RepID=UPI00073D8076|nr:hypothetical protein [Kocuria rhizophila]
MGQRTQLFVTAETDPAAFGGARRHRIGRHHQWRWGPHMVICAAQVVEHLTALMAYPYYRPTSGDAEGVAAIYGVNRATAETSGVSLHEDVSTLNAQQCENNDGTFLVNLTPEGYACGFLIGGSRGRELTTVAGVDGLMAAFGADWSQGPEDVEDEEREWAETMAAAEAAGHLLDQDTAERVTAVEVPGVKTETVWETIPRLIPDAAPAVGTRVQTIRA